MLDEFTRSGATNGPGADAFSILRLLHRDTDGFVTFHTTDGGPYRSVLSARASDLGEALGKLTGERRDLFFSVNGFFRPHRAETNLRYLNAVFLDLDVYRAGLTVGAALGQLVDLQDRGVIPDVSLFARSGRGLWAFWILTDVEGTGAPQRAFPEKLEFYRRIGAELKDRLAAFAPDAKDAVRTARVPRSIHSGTGSRVSYWAQYNTAGDVPTYTLRDLGAALGVPESLKPKRPRAAPSDPEKARKHAGWAGLYSKRLRQFNALRAMRGGFTEGCRNRAALLYVDLLRKNGFGRAEIGRQLELFGGECAPPLPACEQRTSVKSGMRLRKITDQTIADWLDVTPDESAKLEGWPPACRFGRVVDVKSTRADRTAARRQLITFLVKCAGGDVPSSRRMAEILAEQGHTASARTVLFDYQALGFGGGA